MDNTYYEYGEPLEPCSLEQLTIDKARKTYQACLANPAFNLIELRRIDVEQKEIIIVDCENDQVFTKNKVDIHYIERLALIFSAEPLHMPEVRTLRKNFPLVSHQNFAPLNEPTPMCLYQETWLSLERNWTPQRFLKRILWWLTETAKGTLHEIDQPVEPLFFNGDIEVILPTNFEEERLNLNVALVLCLIERSDQTGKVALGEYISISQIDRTKKYIHPLVINTTPIVGERLEKPRTLGEISKYLENRGATLIDSLRSEIGKFSSSGLSSGVKPLLVLHIPMLRMQSGEIERIDTRCYLLKNADLVILAKACEVVDTKNEKDGKYYTAQLLTPSYTSNEWAEIEILPINLMHPFSKEMAREIANIDQKYADFSGLMIGVGALGSHILEVWHREAWGSWTIMDHDYVKPHNIARHICRHSDIGSYKVDAVKSHLEKIYPPSINQLTAISKILVGVAGEEFADLAKKTDLIIDVSTTLEVPRDLSVSEHIKRAASIFLTPSGRGTTLLLEDRTKYLTLATLEAQYYRAIITSSWGEIHLEQHTGHLQVGGSCRDISSHIPNEFVQLLSATLARHIRLSVMQAEALIQVWQVDPLSGAIETHIIKPALPIIFKQNDWTIIWDKELQEKAHKMRSNALPNETGGIILGYIDHKLKHIYIVDLLPAPPDSFGSPTHFIIGTETIYETVKAVEEKTAYVVGYVGEWHSHPSGTTSIPSGHDLKLLKDRATALQENGCPAIMLIASQTDERWILKEMSNE